MTDRLVVVVDGAAQIEYDRRRSLSETQRSYLDRMDEEMDDGIELDHRFVSQPEPAQRQRYVALQLARALQADQESRIAATCSYLANRLPDLQQIRISHHANGGIGIELVFDKPYQEEVKVEFSPTLKLH
ncbi:MAG TPA: hypothetical protein EYP40_06450 [Chromatiales bacterium]|nr:hypothetical protein [Chromatiales bacterium]